MWTIITSVWTPTGWRLRTWRIAADERIQAVLRTHGIVVSVMYEPSQQGGGFANDFDGCVGGTA
jgi:hypothetical protein